MVKSKMLGRKKIPRPDTDPWQDRHVVYAVVNKGGSIVYIGQSKDVAHRMCVHRKRFGASAKCKILQAEFSNETPLQAESKWIRKLLNKGLSLRNINYIKTVYETGEARSSFYVRCMPCPLWDVFKQIVDAHGFRAYDCFFEEAITDWIEKASSESYRAPNMARLKEKRDRWIANPPEFRSRAMRRD